MGNKMLDVAAATEQLTQALREYDIQQKLNDATTAEVTANMKKLEGIYKDQGKSIEERKNALVIPAQYLINDNKVLLDNKKEIEIETGVKNNDWVEVIKGIDKNTTIILPQNK